MRCSYDIFESYLTSPTETQFSPHTCIREYAPPRILARQGRSDSPVARGRPFDTTFKITARVNQLKKGSTNQQNEELLILSDFLILYNLILISLLLLYNRYVQFNTFVYLTCCIDVKGTYWNVGNENYEFRDYSNSDRDVGIYASPNYLFCYFTFTLLHVGFVVMYFIFNEYDTSLKPVRFILGGQNVGFRPNSM